MLHSHDIMSRGREDECRVVGNTVAAELVVVLQRPRNPRSGVATRGVGRGRRHS
jgi:hypothetical protein